MAVLAGDRLIAFCEEITDIEQGVHLCRHEANARKRLADKEAEIGISLTSRGIERVDGGKGVAAGPFIGGDPACAGAGNLAGEFCGNRMPARRRERLWQVLPG